MKKLPFLLAIPFFCFSLSLSAQEDSIAYHNMGMQYFMDSEKYLLTDIDSCILLTQMAADQFEKAENWFMYVLMIGGVGGAYFTKGDNNNAIKYLEKSLKESKARLGEEIYQVLGNYGVIYKDMGQYERSLDYFYKALDKYKEKNDNPFSESIILQNIGLNFQTKGDILKAIQYLNQSLEIKERIGLTQHIYAIENRINLADCYGLLEQFEKEKSLLFSLEKDLLSMVESRNTIRDINLIKIYTQLSDIYWNQQHLDSSKVYAQKALTLQDDDLSLEKSFSYILLGQLAQRQKNLSQAIEYFQEAKQIALIQHESFPYHKDIAEADLLLAESFLEQGQAERALAFYQKALLDLCPKVEQLGALNNPEPSAFTSPKMGLQILKSKAKALQQIARVKGQAEYIDEALSTYLTAAQCVNEIRKSFNSEKAKQLLGEDVLAIYEDAIVLAHQQYQDTKDQNYLKQAFAFAEKNKANLILASLQEDSALGQGGVPDSLIKKENSLKIDINYYKRRIQEAEITAQAEEEMLSSWKFSLLELEQQYDGLQRRFEKDFPKYYELKYDYPELNLADFQAQIPDSKTLILAYFMGEEHQFLFAVTREVLEVYPLNLEVAFYAQIQKVNSLLLQPPSSQQFQAHLQQLAVISQQLYYALIPFELGSEIEQLLIIPDDVLHYLPFEILCKNVQAKPKSFSSSNFDYLINHHSIYYAYSLSLWHQSLRKKAGRASKTWLGFAPSFKSGNRLAQRACTMDELYDLSCSKEEVQAIHAFFGGDILLDKEANKTNFQKMARDYQILHLATHACVDKQNGDLNRIFLTDDFLNNNDLSNYQLNADLAVLSACNTGSGEILKGEGINSLSRGFILAGVPSTLTTLWSVDDCTTSNLMQQFYQYLEKGMAKPSALRQAKLDHLENAAILNTHPYYWAAFIQSGNPVALRKNHLNWWWTGLIIIIAVGTIAYFRKKILV